MKRITKIIIGIAAGFIAVGIVASCNGNQSSGGSQEFPAPPTATVSTVTSTVTTTATVTVTERSTPAETTAEQQLVPTVPAPDPDPDPDAGAAVKTPGPAPATVAEPPAPAAPATTQAQQVEPEPAAESAYFANCSEARAAGAAPLYAGAPGYRDGLDRDDDGVACE